MHGLRYQFNIILQYHIAINIIILCQYWRKMLFTSYVANNTEKIINQGMKSSSSFQPKFHSSRIATTNSANSRNLQHVVSCDSLLQLTKCLCRRLSLAPIMCVPCGFGFRIELPFQRVLYKAMKWSVLRMGSSIFTITQAQTANANPRATERGDYSNSPR